MAAPFPTNPTQLTTLYEQDYCCWLEQTAQMLRAGNLIALDLPNLAEEIEDMGKREKRAVESSLEVLLMHLLESFTPEETLDFDFLPD